MNQRHILLGGLILSLAGCLKPAPVTYYTEPAPARATATIAGEKTDPGLSKSFADLYSYAAGINGDYIADPDKPHNRSIVVTGGQLFLTLGCRLAATTASSSFPVEIKAGEKYTAKCECGPYGVFDQPYVFIWLQDSSGRAVSEKKVARLNPDQSTVIIPIIIPH